MASASVVVDTHEIKKLAAVMNSASLDSSGRRRLMASLGAELEDQTKERFETKQSPEGESWKAISDATKAHYDYLMSKGRLSGDPNQGPLVVGGELRDTVESQASEWAVLTGATKIYAAVHQFGATKGKFGATRRGAPIPWGDIPARPYLGVGPTDEARLVDIAEDFLESVMRRAS